MIVSLWEHASDGSNSAESWNANTQVFMKYRWQVFSNVSTIIIFRNILVFSLALSDLLLTASVPLTIADALTQVMYTDNYEW